MNRTHEEYLADITALQDFQSKIFNVCCSKIVSGMGYKLGRSADNWEIRNASGEIVEQAIQITQILGYWYDLK